MPKIQVTFSEEQINLINGVAKEKKMASKVRELVLAYLRGDRNGK